MPIACMRQHPIRATLAALLVLTATACASTTAPEAALTVTAAATEFVRDSLGIVVISYRVDNAGDKAVYLHTCGANVDAEIDQRAGGGLWTATYAASACYSSYYAGPSRLDPGQSVMGVQSGRLAPGEYRLSVRLALDANSDATRASKSGSITIR
jgi:hypothetical protein